MTKPEPTFFGRCIKVNGQPLFYDSWAPNYVMKISNLQDQYYYRTDQILNLSFGNLKVPSELPIYALEQGDHDLRLFERYLNILNKPNFDPKKIPTSYLEIL